MLLITLLTLFLLSSIPRFIAVQYGKKRTFTRAVVDHKPVAVVFGAGLRRDGGPTAVLADRVRTAADLYFSGKVDKILMSGDNRFLNYNEPGAMKAYAMELQVPEEDIVLDYAGRRTYDTCYRAGAIFGIQEAVLVTQQFHLSRALYTCNQLGVTTIGVAANRRSYSPPDRLNWSIREFPATLVAFIQVHLTRPEPVLGTPEPIFPEP